MASGLQPETGTLKVLNYADYINPDTVSAFESALGTKVEISTYDTEDKLLSNLRNDSLKIDLVIGATTLGLPRYVAGKLVQPLNKEYLPNFSNVLQSLQSPYYDVGSQYSAPYTVYTTGVAYRPRHHRRLDLRRRRQLEAAVGLEVQGLRGRHRRQARGADARHVLPRRHRHQHRRPEDHRCRRGRREGPRQGHRRPLRHPRLPEDPRGHLAHQPGLVGRHGVRAPVPAGGHRCRRARLLEAGPHHGGQRLLRRSRPARSGRCWPTR